MARRNLSRAKVERRRIFRRRIILALGLAGAFYLMVPLFLGDMGILRYFEMRRTYHRVSAEIRELIQGNQRLRQEVDALWSDPETIERIAREQLGLVKEGELVYQFRTPGK